MFMSIRIDVVLPAPLGPSRPKMSPSGTSKERSFTATNSPNRFVTRSKRTAGAAMEEGYGPLPSPPRRARLSFAAHATASWDTSPPAPRGALDRRAGARGLPREHDGGADARADPANAVHGGRARGRVALVPRRLPRGAVARAGRDRRAAAARHDRRGRRLGGSRADARPRRGRLDPDPGRARPRPARAGPARPRRRPLGRGRDLGRVVGLLPPARDLLGRA